ncbi:MAG: glycine cleavage system protein H [Pirellulaceae bacterium]|nr:glycine cleavage system protein H [Pirellulaceae bacterium]
MSQELEFFMGEFRSTYPTDRFYAKNHMWARTDLELSENGIFRFGFSAYAVRLLQDVYFLEWSHDEGATLSEKQEFGFIESKKAESDLYAPAKGRLIKLNEAVLEDPSLINVDKYENGWLFEMVFAEAPTFLTPDEYLEHLNEVWEVTQKTIKGQVNQ